MNTDCGDGSNGLITEGVVYFKEGFSLECYSVITKVSILFLEVEVVRLLAFALLVQQMFQLLEY